MKNTNMRFKSPFKKTTTYIVINILLCANKTNVFKHLFQTTVVIVFVSVGL